MGLEKGSIRCPKNGLKVQEKIMIMVTSSKEKKFRVSRWNKIERWIGQKSLKHDGHGVRPKEEDKWVRCPLT